MDVSIIIVNYKTLPLIVNCINSIIEKSSGISYEVIVVDNNSNDNFNECLKENFGNLVVCVPLSENIGFGRANNEGVKIARGRNIFFLNPDTLLINNAIKILSDYLDADSKVGACGGNLYNEEMKPTHSYSMLLPSIAWELNCCLSGYFEKILWGKNAQFNNTKRIRSVGYICGADLMVKQNVLKQVGSFSDKFFMYYEDTELSYRIKKQGFIIVSIPEAKIQHLEGKSMQRGKQINPMRMMNIEYGLSTYYSLHANMFNQKITQLLRLLRLKAKRDILKKNGLTKDLYVKCKKLIFGHL